MIKNTFWFSLANYLHVDYADIEGIIRNAHNDLQNTTSFSDYSKEMLCAIKHFRDNIEILDL